MFAALCSTVGCSRKVSVERYNERAVKYFQAGKYEEAEIELLNVLRSDRAHPAANRMLGLIAFEQGNIGLAHALLTEARKTLPEDVLVRLRLAQCSMAGAGTQGANEAREEAIALLAKDPTLGEAMVLLVESSISPTQLTDAAMRLEKLKAAGIPEFHVAWGVIQLRARELAAAEESFKAAIAANPKSSLAHVALGKLHALKERPAEAEASYKRAAEFAGIRSPHRLHYIDAKVAAGDVAEAKRLLDEILKAAPDYSFALTRVARIAMAEKRYDDAEAKLYAVLKKDALNFEAILLLGRLRLAQEKTEAAGHIFESLAKHYPRAPQAHYQLAVARLKQSGAVSEAATGLNKAIALQPDYTDATLLLAEVNLQRGDTAAAISALARLVNQRRGFPQAPLLLAVALQAQGKLEDALSIYQQIRPVLANNPEIPWRMATLQRQLGKTDEARKNCEAALAIAPDFLIALEELVAIEIAERRFSAARERLEKQPVTTGNQAHVQLLLGRTYLAEENTGLAEAALLKAIEYAPEATEAHMFLARLYVTSNRHREALDRLQEVVKRNHRDIGAWLQLASLHSELKETARAQHAYETVLTINPRLVPALNNLAWLLVNNGGDIDKAFDLISQARRLQPNDPIVADTLGWIHYQKGEFARALVLIREAAAKLSSDPQVVFHLGMVHYMMGDETLAKNAFKIITSKDKDGEWGKEAERRARILAIDPQRATTEASGYLERMAEELGNDPVVLARIGGIAERDGHWAAAVIAYEKALAINSNFLPAMIRLAELHSKHVVDSERALHYAWLARKIDPDNATISYILGRHTLMTAATGPDFQRALSLLQDSARKQPDDLNVATDLAWASYAVGRVDEARALMKRVAGGGAGTRAREAQRFIEISSLAENREKLAGRVKDLEAAAAEDPNAVPAWVALAQASENQQDFRGAILNYEKVLTRYPLFVPAMVNLARIYFGPVRDHVKAYDYANRARELLPRDPQVARILGMIEYDRERYPRAAQLLAETSEQWPTDADVFYRLGIARHRLKQMSDSKEALKKALELAPNSPLATHARLILAELK